MGLLLYAGRETYFNYIVGRILEISKKKNNEKINSQIDNVNYYATGYVT